MTGKAFVALALVALLIGTGGYVVISSSADAEERVVCVTMPWQGEIVDNVSMGTISIKVMVGVNADPHASAAQPGAIVGASKAMAYFTIGTGIEWEETNVPTIRESLPNLPIIPMAEGIQLLAGGCHSEEEHAHGDVHDHAHEHVFDPHVWTSPKNLKIMSEKVRDKLKEIDPDNAPKYDEGFTKYAESIDKLDAFCAEKLTGLSGHILVWHGAWKYLFNDCCGDGTHGISEEALQHIPGFEKSPTPSTVKPLLDEGYEFFYYPRSGVSASVLSALEENGITPVIADPTAYNLSDEIRSFVTHLAEHPPKECTEHGEVL